MELQKNVSVDVYNTKKIEDILGQEGFAAQRIEEILTAFPNATINLEDHGLDWQTADGDLHYLAGNVEALRIIVDMSYPFFSHATLIDGLKTFEKTEATYLITHSPRGLAIPALIITNGFDSFDAAKHDCFPYMVSEKEAVRVNSGDDLPTYSEFLEKGFTHYSSEEQLQFATKYKDNLGDYYGKDISHDPELTRSSRDAPERIETLLRIETGERCLDVGCSCGIITAKLAEMGKIMTGVEIVPELYEEAEQLKNSLPEGIRRNLNFINAPIEKCKFEPASFNTVYLTETFEHIPHFVHNEMFKEIIKYLEPEGSVIFSVPNRYPAPKYVEEKRYRWDWYNHVTHYTAKSVEYFLRKYFRNIRFYPVYPEPVNQGVFLICKAWEKN